MLCVIPWLLLNFVLDGHFEPTRRDGRIGKSEMLIANGCYYQILWCFGVHFLEFLI